MKYFWIFEGWLEIFSKMKFVFFKFVLSYLLKFWLEKSIIYYQKQT